MTSRGDTRWLWYNSMIELAVNIAASLVLLRWFGLIGIAFGTLFAFCVEKGLMLWYVRRRYHLSIADVFSFRTWALYAALLVVTYITALWIFGE